MSAFYQIMLIVFYQSTIRRPITRRCRRLPRVQGWWDIVWNSFDNKRFKQNFRVTQATFTYILHEIEPALSKITVAEEPVPSEVRLAVCLYRLARGDYLHTVSELVGLGTATVCLIVKEVCESILACLWETFVANHMPTNLM